MTPITPLKPEQVKDSPSIKIYQESCEAKAKQEGKPAGTFELGHSIIVNRLPGDGKFEILNTNPEQDFFCAAQIQWDSGELLIDSGSPNKKNRVPLLGIWAQDGCALTRTLAGKAELGGQYCEDGKTDPRLEKIANFESMKLYLEGCNHLLKEHGQKFGRNLDGEVQLGRVRLLNEIPGDGSFDLLFSSGAYNFVCNGTVGTMGQHSLMLSTGKRKDLSDLEPVTLAQLNDACTVTRTALGNEEVPPECHDKTKGERLMDTGLEYAWHGLLLGLAGRDVYKWIKGKPTLTGNLWRAIRHPSTIVNGLRALPGQTMTALRGIPVLFSRAGAALGGIPGGLRLAYGAVRAFGAMNVPALFGGAGAAGGGTTVAAGGGTVATAGVGATLGVAAVGLAIGVGAGVLIENVPRWLGSKYSVSDGISWGIDSGVGITAWGVAKVVGKSTEEVKRSMTQTNITLLDHMGFGGWNVFKQSWGF